MKYPTIIREEVKTMFVPAVGGVSGAKQAFLKLESNFPSLRGRKFYGVVPKDGDYLACTRIEEGENPSQLGLEIYIIPGGKYVTYRIIDWLNKLQDIGSKFVAMAEENELDHDRPTVEYYRSFKELILMLPVR